MFGRCPQCLHSRRFARPSGDGDAIGPIASVLLRCSVTSRRAIYKLMRRSKRCAAQTLLLPIAAFDGTAIGGAPSAADLVRCQGYRVSRSDIDLFRDLDRIIDLDAEVTHGSLDLGVPEKELDSAEVPGSPVDQNCLRSTQRVCAKLRRIEPVSDNPFSRKPGQWILA